MGYTIEQLKYLQENHPGKKTDFNFLLGRWKVHNILFREPENIEFNAALVVMPILNGFGNIDTYTTDVRPKLKERIYASTLRVLNPETKLWHLYWIDSRFPTNITPEQVGSFNGKIGEFYADNVKNSEVTITKFEWTNLDTEIPRWEQFFSKDDGKSWQLDWRMDFHENSELKELGDMFE